MRFLLLLTLFSVSSFAAEVATLEARKTTNELLLVLTDDQLANTLDKTFGVKCKFRVTNSSFFIKEHYFPTVCRAFVVKFLMDAGYRPDQFYHTFSK